ncbi:MAG: hypothetical protein NC433_03710 [Clostridiales bacterium]|nr:hypothetical protein [Clostridiales bacterium]
MKKCIKSVKIVITISVLLFILYGCGKEALPNTYVAGSDFQYMQMDSAGDYTGIQQGKDGYYLRHGDYIYYLDELSGEIAPLCSRVDCLHDKEMDQNRKDNCNAYVKNQSDNSRGIAYCNENIYCFDGSTWIDHGETQIIYRISVDGSKKEKIYQWDDNRRILRWIIHRDVLYYVEQKFMEKENGEDTELIEISTLYAIDLTKAVPRPKIIYTVNSEEVIQPVIAHVKCFGNYMYFLLNGDRVMESDAIIHTFTKGFIYDIEKQTLSELKIPDMQEDEQVSSIVFWQDKILFKVIKGYEQDYFKTVTIYIANLDGSDERVYLEDIMGHNYYSDGKYLIKTDAAMVFLASLGYVDYDKEEGTYWVYNSDLELVDSFILPSEIHVADAPRMGNVEEMFMLYDNAINSEKWGVLRWDKSKIGDYKGGRFEVTVIPYYDGD